MPKVMIVDDHELVRLGLKGLLANHDNLTFVAEAGTLKDAVAKAAQVRPDVILMDVRLPDGSGVDACKAIHEQFPDVKIIMLTSFPDDEIVIDSIMAGASGFVLKEIKGNSLVDAIQRVAKGESLLDPNITGKVLNFIKDSSKNNDNLDKLSPQELKVLELVSEGKTNKEIGCILYLSEKTVRNHLSRIMKKLDLSNRAQAAAYYVEHRKLFTTPNMS
ncbi:response regulator transcription factor [Desulfitibacter alkalitolerans]|uniref:response regulator transcription factor n=1 Tax=Desulfitibacter alkalitolerans TaxID=264641 RepID=UPI0004891CF2|nr:response regulator transcription factor [Desulfitibacter alkalitolerans]